MTVTTGPTVLLCDDCEIAPATAIRICNDDGEPYNVCDGCDPGPGCRPIITRDRYSNGKPSFSAKCWQCGWVMTGSSETERSAREAANRHKAGL